MDDDKQLLRKRRVLYIILEVVLSSSQLTFGLMAHLRDSRVSILLIISGSLGVLPILCTFFLSSHVPVHLYSLDMLMSLIVMLSGVLDINVALTYKTRFPYQVFVSIGLLYIMSSAVIFHLLWNSENCVFLCRRCHREKNDV